MNVKVDHTIVNKNASILGVDMFVLVTSDLNSRKRQSCEKGKVFHIVSSTKYPWHLKRYDYLTLPLRLYHWQC
jgi:predicted transcriptional regulator